MVDKMQHKKTRVTQIPQQTEWIRVLWRGNQFHLH
jgi:hypothetical protein